MKEEKLVSKKGEWEFSKESWVQSEDNWQQGSEIILKNSSGKILDLTDSSDKVDLLNLQGKEDSKKWLLVAAHEEGWFKLTKPNSGRVLTATTDSSTGLPSTAFTEGNLLFLKALAYNWFSMVASGPPPTHTVF